MKRGHFIALFLVACGGSKSGPPATTSAVSESPPAPAEPVTLELVADATAVGAGQELALGAKFKIAEGWRIFWVNPGETGETTTVKFGGPDGFDVGRPRFPGPVRFETSGATSYGHQGEVLISSLTIAPDSVKPDGARFSASASWLACKQSCVRGQGTATLSLPRASASHPAQPIHQRLWATHNSMLPRALSELPAVRHRWADLADGTELVIYADGADEIEYFPSRESQNELSGQATVPRDGVTALHISMRGTPSSVGGVLRVARAQFTTYYILDLGHPEAANKK